MQQSVDQGSVHDAGLDRPDLPRRFDSVEAFASAYAAAEGDWELVDGEVERLSPETIGHSLVKTRIGVAFVQAIEAQGSSLLLAIDGPTLKTSPRRGRKPDVVVFRREAVRLKDIVATEPLLVVEVLSAWSVRTDTVVKLGEYFSLASLAHYLVVDPDSQRISWHRRRNGSVATSVHHDGVLDFADLGIAVDVGSIWPTG